MNRKLISLITSAAMAAGMITNAIMPSFAADITADGDELQIETPVQAESAESVIFAAVDADTGENVPGIHFLIRGTQPNGDYVVFTAAYILRDPLNADCGVHFNSDGGQLEWYTTDKELYVDLPNGTYTVTANNIPEEYAFTKYTCNFTVEDGVVDTNDGNIIFHLDRKKTTTTAVQSHATVLTTAATYIDHDCTTTRRSETTFHDHDCTTTKPVTTYGTYIDHDCTTTAPATYIVTTYGSYIDHDCTTTRRSETTLPDHDCTTTEATTTDIPTTTEITTTEATTTDIPTTTEPETTDIPTTTEPEETTEPDMPAPDYGTVLTTAADVYYVGDDIEIHINNTAGDPCDGYYYIELPDDMEIVSMEDNVLTVKASKAGSYRLCIAGSGCAFSGYITIEVSDEELPETGFSGLHDMAAAAAFMLLVTGAALTAKTKRRDEE